MKRKFVRIENAITEAKEILGITENVGLCALYDIENMGFCKDSKTRWYQFTDFNGNKCYTLKR